MHNRRTIIRPRGLAFVSRFVSFRHNQLIVLSSDVITRGFVGGVAAILPISHVSPGFGAKNQCLT